MRMPTKSMPSKEMSAYHGILPALAKDPAPRGRTHPRGAYVIGIFMRDLLARLLIKLWA
jgi:hypothetical protein